jgi:hypothetical protein
MILIPAPGSQDMQAAVSNRHVLKLVELLVDEVGSDLFMLIASIIRTIDQKTSSDFLAQIQEIRKFTQRELDENGQYIINPYIEDLCNALTSVYEDPQRVVGYRRGAIVELLTYELVTLHCSEDECKHNHRFHDASRKYNSDQVDVAVLSHENAEIEGYTCKVNARAIQSEDCTNLHELIKRADEQHYDVHVGAVCFANSHMIDQRLKKFAAEEDIKSYGLDNLALLKQSPFS